MSMESGRMASEIHNENKCWRHNKEHAGCSYDSGRPRHAAGVDMYVQTNHANPAVRSGALYASHIPGMQQESRSLLSTGSTRVLNVCRTSYTRPITLAAGETTHTVLVDARRGGGGGACLGVGRVSPGGVETPSV